MIVYLILLIKADFIQIEKDTVKGKLYFDKEKRKIKYEVSYPLNQIITVNANTTLVYYPERKLAFRFTTKTFDPTKNFLFKNEFEILQKLGFNLIMKKTKKDTIFCYYNDNKGNAILIKKWKKHITEVYQEFKNKPIARVKIFDFKKLTTDFFPSKILIEVFYPQKYSYKMFFMNVREVVDSASIFEIELPEDVKIKEEQW